MGLRCGRQDDRPTFAGRIFNHVLSQQAADGVTKLHRQLRSPKAALLLGGYYLLLAKHGAGPDIAVGVPVNLRNAALRDAIGYYVNMLPVRLRVEPTSQVRDILGSVKTTFFESLAHADAPAESFLDQARTSQQSSWRTTLFRHVFNYVPQDLQMSFRIAGMPARQLAIENGTSKYDLEFVISDSAATGLVSATYNPRAFHLDEVRLLVERYDDLLCALPSNVDTTVAGLSALSPCDRTALELRRTASQIVDDNVLDAIHRQALSQPDATALMDAERSITYGQLWAAAETTAAALGHAGVSRGALVALPVERGVPMAVGLLACWLVGAVCMPCRPRLPSEDTSAREQEAVLVAGPAEFAVGPVPVIAIADIGPAGSVGPPPDADTMALRFPDAKRAPSLQLVTWAGPASEPGAATGLAPCMLSHRELGRTVGQVARHLSICGPDVVMWSAPVTQPDGVLELLLALVSGAGAAIRPAGGSVRDAIDRYCPTVIHLRADQLRDLMRAEPSLLKGARVLCGEGRLAAGLARSVLANCDALHSGYRPVTTALYAAVGQIEDAGTAHIRLGRPVLPDGLVVSDGDGRPMPVGLRGPLLVTTDDGARTETGDQGVLCEDGTLRLVDWAEPIPLGPSLAERSRTSQTQVELVLLAHRSVWAATVIDFDRADMLETLAFVEPDPDLDETAYPGVASELETLCGDLARSHGIMVPTRIVPCHRLPVTTAGQFDVAALRSRASSLCAAVTPAPDTDVDLLESLVSLWRELLATSAITAESDFFYSGGHSLLGAQLVGRIKKLTGSQVRLADLFENPTPAAMGRLISEPGTQGIQR
jgi:non-ribosomal peptide synthetase component F